MLSNEKRLAQLSEITGANLWKEIRPKDDSLLEGFPLFNWLKRI